jgi:VIT1/CCC1 family predicted Fe2+/Mn2+ transporter
MQEAIVEALAKDKDKWVHFMMKFELGLEKPDINRARNSAATIGISYVIGGIIPLSPYFLVDDAILGSNSLWRLLCWHCLSSVFSKVESQVNIHG